MEHELPDSTSGSGGIYACLRERAKQRPTAVALVGNRRCRYPRLVYGELIERVESLRRALAARGVGHGDKVGLVSENCDRWLIANLALLSLGAIDVPRGADASAEEIQFCLEHSGAKAVFVEDLATLEKVGELRHRLDPVIVLNSGENDLPSGVFDTERLLAEGAALGPDSEPELPRVRDGDVATIIYTSGTTGNPKGVVLTHANILHNLEAVPRLLDLQPGMRYISFLPTWHIFERTLEYIVLERGMELHYSSKWSLKQDFPRIQPHLAAAVPRVWEGFFSAIDTGLRKKPAFVRRIVEGALEGSRVRTEAYRRLRGLRLDREHRRCRATLSDRLGVHFLGLLLLLPHCLADRLVYRKVRAATGGAMTAGISGGGPLPDYVDEFLTRAGLPLLNGYGLTETAPVLSVRVPKRNILGTIGQPLPHTEVRIVGDDGELRPTGQTGVIQVRGPQIMREYYANPTATQAALPGEGWFHTGDLGHLSTEGDLVITGRAKDTIVLSGGENVEPEPIETAISRSPLIADAVLVGHGEKVLSALVVPAFDAVRSQLGIDEPDDAALARRPETGDLLHREVNHRISLARGYRNFELIGHVAALERPFSVEEGTATATLKKRRAPIEALYADLIRQFYA